MAALSDEQIAGIALNAGFTGNALTIAVAVALAESGGDPRAHNTNAATGDNSYGLWQINMLGSMGPARRKQFGISKNEDLFDPSINARAAFMLWKARGGFGDWSVYNRGTYLTRMSRATAAVRKNGGKAIATGNANPNDPKLGSLNRPDTPLPDGIENTIYDLRDSLAGIKGVVDFVTDSKNWVRVAMFAGGSLLCVLGGLMFIGQSRTARNVAGLVPVGRAVKAAKAVK